MTLKRYISVWYGLIFANEIAVGRGEDRRTYPHPSNASLRRVQELMDGKPTRISLLSNSVNMWQNHDK